jgi:hypothetical protein
MVDSSSLEFDCPACGAMSGEKCFNLVGYLRFESHVERKWIAQDRRPVRSSATAIPQRSREFE